VRRRVPEIETADDEVAEVEDTVEALSDPGCYATSAIS
jgi:hypothetical protein